MISISERQKAQILSKIIEIENFALPPSDGGITVRAFGERIVAECAELANSSDSVTPVFRTALVINWPEKAMESRYKRFRELFPQITTLSHLKHAMDSSSALSFCKRYLDINANKSAAKENPKYSLLRELTNGFLDYQEKNNLPTEMAAIRKWCVDVDLKQLKKDFIGKRRGIGPGVVANLRLCLGDGDIVSRIDTLSES